MKSEFEDLKELIDNLWNKVDSLEYDPEEAEAQYWEYEEKLERLEANNWREIDLSQLKKKMKHLKDGLDLYEAEGELDMMYPDRHDEDFDEDEISGESFFKD